jgi:deoxyribodipyrimidine photo-lyase
MAPKRKQAQKEKDDGSASTAPTTNEAVKRDTKRAKPNESIAGDPSSSTSTSNPANQNDWNPTPGKLPESGNEPVLLLRSEMKKHGECKSPPSDGGNVLYVMGMKSLRIEDNRGIAHASHLAQERKKAGGKGSGNLIVIFFISPTDWKMHDRGPRRIDFVLRNLREIKKQLDELNIPLVVYTSPSRKDMPKTLVNFAKQWDVKEIVGNVEYEVDECWRDVAILKAVGEAGLYATFLEDTYVVPAFHLETKTGHQYAVFSPWNRAWTAHIEKNMHLIDESPSPEANDKGVRTGKLGNLFDRQDEGFGIPEYVEGYECKDAEYMRKLWPAGSHSARKVLSNFVRGKGGESAFEDRASELGHKQVAPDSKDSRLNRYGIGRNLCSENGTSRLSPYLAAGVISPRACLRATMEVDKNKFKVGRSTGTETWNTEVSP